MDFLNDQYKHEEWIDLGNDEGVQTGSIRVVLQWIHSRRKFVQDILRVQD